MKNQLQSSPLRMHSGPIVDFRRGQTTMPGSFPIDRLEP